MSHKMYLRATGSHSTSSCSSSGKGGQEKSLQSLRAVRGAHSLAPDFGKNFTAPYISFEVQYASRDLPCLPHPYTSYSSQLRSSDHQNSNHKLVLPSYSVLPCCNFPLQHSSKSAVMYFVFISCTSIYASYLTEGCMKAEIICFAHPCIYNLLQL